MDDELDSQDRIRRACAGEGRPQLDERIFSKLTLEDLPIPRDVQVHDGWPPILAELADHVGPYEALLICDAFSGREVYIPLDVERSPFTGLISDKSVAIVADVFGRERLPIPTGSGTILHAKRQGVIAAIRAGRLNVVRGSRILRVARRHLSRLVNQTDEGLGYAPIEIPEPRVLVALREAAAIAADALQAVSAPFDIVETTTAKILDIFFRPTAHSDEVSDV